MIASVTYRGNGAVSRSCLSMYQDLMTQYYTNLNSILTQRCSNAVNVNMNVSFVRSLPLLIKDNIVKVGGEIILVFDYRFSYIAISRREKLQHKFSMYKFQMNFVLVIVPEIHKPQFYDLCGSTLNLIFDLSVPHTSIVIEPLLNVSAIGNQCPPLRALESSISRGFTCSIGEVLNNDTNNVPRCRKCKRIL